MAKFSAVILTIVSLSLLSYAQERNGPQNAPATPGDYRLKLEDGTTLIVRTQIHEGTVHYKVWRTDRPISDWGFYFPLKIRFDIGGLCNKKAAQWSRVNAVKLVQGDRADAPDTGGGDVYVDVYADDSSGCTLEIAKPAVVQAGTKTYDPPEPTAAELISIQARREADAGSAAARKKQTQDEETDRKARIEAARQAEIQRKKTLCAGVYRNTVNKKTGDLTVLETDQVSACKLLGLYYPKGIPSGR
jgi:hypothetical protein